MLNPSRTEFRMLTFTFTFFLCSILLCYLYHVRVLYYKVSSELWWIFPDYWYRSCFDVCGADDPDPTATDSRAQPSVGTLPFQQFQKVEHCKSANCNGESLERSISVPTNLVTSGYHRHSSGSLIPEQVLSPYLSSDLERYFVFSKVYLFSMASISFS